MSKRSRIARKERLVAAATVETTDPAALAVYANSLRPYLATLRTLAEDATAPTGTRVHSRTYIRAEVLRTLRVLEVRINAAAPPAVSPVEPANSNGVTHEGDAEP